MSLEIKAVKNIDDMSVFIRIPLSIPAYIEMGQRPQPDTISNYHPAANPVHRHLKTEYFMAFMDNTPVGRIAAIKDFLNPDQGTGFFGCFESQNDPGAASALIDTARRWLADNGCPRMIGPATFNTNQQVGLLIEGYEYGPRIMLPYNPPYYSTLMENYGLVKHTDLVTFSWRREMGVPPKIARVAERLRGEGSVCIRRFNLNNIRAEAMLIRDMFNGSMYANWGFIPLTSEESEVMLNYCRMYADRDLMTSVWVDGRPAGILLFLPACFPGPQPVRTVRAAILGVVPRHRHRGLDSCLIEHAIKTLLAKGYEQADLSMVHEENTVVIKILTETIRATPTRRYRVYQN